MTAKRDRLTGAGAQLVTEVTINFGSSLAGLLIPVVGSPVVVAVRQLVMAITVLPFYRPQRVSFTWARLWPALLLGVVLAVMNLTFYESVARLGLGARLGVSLGPFLVADRRCYGRDDLVDYGHGKLLHLT